MTHVLSPTVARVYKSGASIGDYCTSNCTGIVLKQPIENWMLIFGCASVATKTLHVYSIIVEDTIPKSDKRLRHGHA
jgi:hypothetical protein